MLRVLVCARYLEGEGCGGSRARIALEAEMKLTLNGSAIAGSVFGPALGGSPELPRSCLFGAVVALSWLQVRPTSLLRVSLLLDMACRPQQPSIEQSPCILQPLGDFTFTILLSHNQISQRRLTR